MKSFKILNKLTMKYLNLLIVVIIPSISFGQISYKDILLMEKMSYDEKNRFYFKGIV